MEEDALGSVYPSVNTDACVSCHRCEKVCPILHPADYYGTERCYAAWNRDEKQRLSSASGGIAAAIYSASLERGSVAVGASMNKDWSVTHKIATEQKELTVFKNSKYVFSSAYDVFPHIKKLLREKRKVVMVGLPCQIAAMRKLFGACENLLLVDIVCHGSTPVPFLRQHIRSLESACGRKAVSMSFRAPEKGTPYYYFALYDDEGKIFYAKRSADGDVYNIAFHRMISYRENCYRCRFARPERVSDITLGDYHGLGRVVPSSYSEEHVSAILVHTEKGREMIESLIEQGAIHAELRPVEEPVEGDAQLRRPSPKTLHRMDFERFIRASHGNFEYSIARVLRRARQREIREKLASLPRRAFRKLLRMMGLNAK